MPLKYIFVKTQKRRYDHEKQKLESASCGFCSFGGYSDHFIVYISNAHDEFKEKVRVNADGITQETLTVKALKLYPSDEKEYEIDLVCNAEGSFYIILDYEKISDGKMKHFVEVTITADEAVIYEGIVAALLDEDTAVAFEGVLGFEEPLVIKIIYRMPQEIGNEAQGTTATFDINLNLNSKIISTRNRTFDGREFFLCNGGTPIKNHPSMCRKELFIVAGHLREKMDDITVYSATQTTPANENKRGNSRDCP